MNAPKVISLLALSLVLSGSNLDAAALSKIHLAPDGQGFVDARGKPFVPFGVTYYRPRTGWAPQVWKDFDAAATRKDFERMKSLGVNCVRVFLSFGSFYNEPGTLNPAGLAKFDQFLAIAEAAGIYVHPTGPDLWEGPPDWPIGGIDDERTLGALESFWKLFAARYRDRAVIFSYDLRNEPAVGWKGLETPWNQWLKDKYASDTALRAAWNDTNAALQLGSVPVPSADQAPKDRRLLDFQSFREHLADEWTRRQTAAIKSADPAALVTIGLVQWSIPSLLPALSHYSGFRPVRQGRYLDYLTIHFYPLEDNGYKYGGPESLQTNLAYLEGVVRETALAGLPVVLGEFGWYGGGTPRFNNGQFPAATQAQQAEYCRRAVEVSRPFVCGWLNWGLSDDPDATDCSELTGLLTVDGAVKDWGRAFQKLAAGGRPRAERPGDRPALDWEACLTSLRAERAFRQKYFRSFSNNP
jgi:hypothetical protein